MIVCIAPIVDACLGSIQDNDVAVVSGGSYQCQVGLSGESVVSTAHSSTRALILTQIPVDPINWTHVYLCYVSEMTKRKTILSCCELKPTTLVGAFIIYTLQTRFHHDEEMAQMDCTERAPECCGE